MSLSIPKLSQILPSRPNLLMGAGPVPVPAEVAAANSIVINHLGETMNRVLTHLNSMAQYVFQTSSNKILGISGPSSAGMEMAMTSLLWPGRRVLVLNLGTFSARFGELARGIGAHVTELHPNGPMMPFFEADVRKHLEQNHYDVITIVQGETSCGIRNIELEQIVKTAKEFGLMTVVDAVSTLSTMSLQMDDWGIDVVITGGQKGLSCVAGMSLIAFSETAFDFVMKRTAPMPHWCLDPRRAYKFWIMNEYHYTAPVTGILAMYEALRLICEETLPARFERHRNSSLGLQSAIEALGLELYAPSECRLNSVVAIKLPAGINAKELLAHMMKQNHVEISGAFGLPIVRIGQMGEQCRPENVQRVMEALEEGLIALGAPVKKQYLKAI